MLLRGLRNRALKATLLHLRFPFVFVLAPIFVWGAHWAPGAWSGRTTLGFLLVHLALYPGANAFNSAFDRDTGPIGGLARPPAVPRGLAAWSTLLQGAGAALAPLVGWNFAAAYVALWAVFTAYSHPRTRWKRSPLVSSLAIVLGQGGLGWALGWAAAGGPLPGGAVAAWSMAGSCAAVAALYPLTQLYQLAADRQRRDRTLAAVLGCRGTFLWIAGGFAGVAAAAWALGRPGLGIATVHVALAAVVIALACPAGWAPSHRWVMAVAYANSAAFLVYLVGSG